MKKFNKFLSGLLSLAMAATCVCTSAFADTTDTATVVKADSKTVIAGGTYVGDWNAADGMVCLYNSEKENKAYYEVEIPLTVEATGDYQLMFEAHCSLVTTEYHISNMSFKIDDGDYAMILGGTDATSFTSTGKSSKSYHEALDNLMYNSAIHFEAGSHTITFMANEKRSNQKDAVDCALGDITITPDGYIEPTDIDPDVPTVIKGGTYYGDWNTNGTVSYLWNTAEKTDGSGYVMRVPLKVEKSGDYKLSMEAILSPETGSYHFSNINLKVDDGEYVKLLKSNYTTIGTSNKSYGGSTASEIAYTPVINLEAGVHNLYFMADTKRLNQKDGIYAVIGDITITPASYVPPTEVSATAVTTIAGGTYIGDWTDGGTFAYLADKPVKDGGYVVKVALDVKEVGDYHLAFEALCSPVNAGYHLSNLKFKVDDGDYATIIKGTNCTSLGNSSKAFNSTALEKLSYNNTITFNTTGIHNLYFMSENARTAGNKGVFAALGDIEITPINRPKTVSATEATVIKGGTFTVGAQTTTDTNGNTLVGSTGAKSSVTVKLDVEKSGYYKLSFGGAFNDTLSEYHLSKMRFAIDNGRDNAGSEVDRTDYLLNGKNVTATTPDSAGTVWGNPVKNYTYNEYVKLTEGEHDLYFVVDDVREHKDGGYMAVLGDITLEPMDDIVLNAATSAVFDGYAKSGSNGTIHASATTGSQAEFEFEIFEDGWYQINAELMVDMTGNEAGTSPINFKLDEAAAYKLTSENTSDKGDLGFGVTNWGNYHSYNIGAPVELAKGTHKITFTASEPVTSDNAAVITGIRNVSIKNAENIGIESVEITLPETDVEFNPEENIIGSATITSDGEAVDFDAFTSYSYESSNTDVAVIDAYGEITVTGSGKATITFKASVMGDELSASADLYVYKNGLCVYDITTGTASASAKIKTTSAVTGENVYAAAYSGKAMKSAAKFEKNASGVYEISVPVSSGEKAKCFVWGGNDGMAPFAGAIELN